MAEHNSTHEIVNHSEGFRNEEGNTTNKIKNLWSHLKSELRTRRGIMRVRLEDFIYEFQFKRKYIKSKTDTNLRLDFSNLISIAQD